MLKRIARHAVELALPFLPVLAGMTALALYLRLLKRWIEQQQPADITDNLPDCWPAVEPPAPVKPKSELLDRAIELVVLLGGCGLMTWLALPGLIDSDTAWSVRLMTWVLVAGAYTQLVLWGYGVINRATDEDGDGRAGQEEA